uniref:Polysaccharide biosynthesis domain-containing protein n=1 Tax=Acrobeloides nanus TaxID=290746 RepID=A0A914CIL2_9BILA
MVDLETQLSDNSDKYINDPSIELAWALKAAERATIHMNLLMSVDTKLLKLTKHDKEIYQKFREIFPEMNVEEVIEAQLKGDIKPVWNEFCESFKTDVEDYNLGTIMRIRADGVYNEQNTIIVPKIIYLAIETARNIEGINSKHKEKYTEEYKRSHADGEKTL